MSMPKFWNTFTAGNVVTIAGMLVGGLLVFAEVRTEVRAIREIVMEMKRENDSAEVRLRAVELGFGRIEERLVAIQINLQQIAATQSQRHQNGGPP